MEKKLHQKQWKSIKDKYINTFLYKVIYTLYYPIITSKHFSHVLKIPFAY